VSGKGKQVRQEGSVHSETSETAAAAKTSLAPSASRSHRIYHKRWCTEHNQQEVCLCTLSVDHADRRTTVSKSQQARARWCERVNRAHRGAWVHERNVRAWLRVYGRIGPSARAFVGTYARDVDARNGSIWMHKGLDRQSLDELALLDLADQPAF
jgi:hypothetical protein